MMPPPSEAINREALPQLRAGKRKERAMIGKTKLPLALALAGILAAPLPATAQSGEARAAQGPLQWVLERPDNSDKYRAMLRVTGFFARIALS